MGHRRSGRGVLVSDLTHYLRPTAAIEATVEMAAEEQYDPLQDPAQDPWNGQTATPNGGTEADQPLPTAPTFTSIAEPQLRESQRIFYDVPPTWDGKDPDNEVEP